MLSTTALVVGTIGVSAGVGAIAMKAVYRNRLKRNESISASAYHEKQRERIREVLSSEDKFRSTPLTLYQFETCPYCHKVKCFLDHHKVQYEQIEVNVVSKEQISHSEYKKVPQLQLGTNGPLLVDSSEIVKEIKPLLDPSTPSLSPSEEEWTERSKKLLKFLLLNTNRSVSEAKENFAYADKTNFPARDKFMLKHVFPLVMYAVTKRVLKPRIIKEENLSANMDEREELYKEVNHWIDAGVGEGPFQGGNEPNLSDINYYAILKSQSPFPVFSDLRANAKQPNFDQWYQRMTTSLAKE